MKRPTTKRNHYVPQWYQRRFLSDGESRFFYLDKTPDMVVSSGGKSYRRSELLRWGPNNCFVIDDLYTLKLGGWSSDLVESRFFGPIDAKGKRAIEFLSSFDPKNLYESVLIDTLSYMDAQRFRTPRGLDHLKLLTQVSDQNITLTVMRHIFEYHSTMWAEGVWEIVNANTSKTKFLLTDSPVTFYNEKAFPNSVTCKYPRDVELSEVGTRTIFPLGINQCLIITHLELVRDPSINRRRSRTNARAYDSTIFNFLDVQFGRELEEDEVIRLNCILKRRASRYIAATVEEWLYPEKYLQTEHWSKLDSDWFLFPNPYNVHFTSTTVVGYESGAPFVVDEYGRKPGHKNYEDQAQRDREWARSQKARVEWALKRDGKQLSKTHQFGNKDAAKIMMREDIEKVRGSKKRFSG